MQREIAKAEYLIALTSNAVTEEVRNNYFLYVIENKDNGFKVFESIVETIIASMKLMKWVHLHCMKELINCML